MKEKFNFFPPEENVSLREGFGRALVTLGHKRDDFFLFDADVAGGTGANLFAKNFPDRVIQFGIAEQNVMAAAAGFTESGLIPLVVGFGSFTIMRSHEQLRTAVCYGERNVKICCSHVGVDTGPDGATAQMLEDLAVCRSIPNLTVVVPSCANEIQPMLEAVLETKGPVYMRIGRSPSPIVYKSPQNIDISQADRVRRGKDVTLMACGTRVAEALNAADNLAHEGIDAEVINMRSIKPLDLQMINRCCSRTGAIVTIEDHSVLAGLGGAVAEVVVRHHPVPVEIVGIPDCFGTSGEHTELFSLFRINQKAIVSATRRVMARKKR